MISRQALLPIGLTAAFAIWCLLAGLVAPALIESAHAGDGPALLERALQGRAEHPVGFYLSKWASLAARVSAVGLILLPLSIPRLRRPPGPSVALLLLLTLWVVGHIPDDVAGLRRSSHELIAAGIVEGHGFTSDGSYRDAHLGTPSRLDGSDARLPTAFKEPVYPSIVAGAFLLFGDAGRWAVLVFNAVCLVLGGAALFALGRALFGAPTGLLAAVLWLGIPFSRRLAVSHLSSEVLAAPLIVLALWAGVRCLRKPSLRRGLGTGGLVGLAAMVHSGSLALAPIAFVLLLLSRSVPMATRWRTGAAVLLAATLMVLPWTLRNRAVFGEWVAIRTGFGINLYFSNPILSEAFSPGPYACSDVLGPFWTATSAADALSQLSDQTRRHALFFRARDCFEQDPPAGYAQMNEIQIDAEYQRRALAFLAQEPALGAALAFERIRRFLFTNVDPVRAVLTVFALLGALGALATPGGRLVVLTLATLCAPYTLANDMFSRYRYPVEPLILLLASAAVVWPAAWLRRRVRTRIADAHAIDEAPGNPGRLDGAPRARSRAIPAAGSGPVRGTAPPAPG